MYHKNIIHYNWHWFWDFGNGEIGNQGVHQMDIARWAIPGGKFYPNGSDKSEDLGDVDFEMGPGDISENFISSIPRRKNSWAMPKPISCLPGRIERRSLSPRTYSIGRYSRADMTTCSASDSGWPCELLRQRTSPLRVDI